MNPNCQGLHYPRGLLKRVTPFNRRGSGKAQWCPDHVVPVLFHSRRRRGNRMVVNNMGTPGHPEGLPHFSVKSMLALKLKSCLRPKPGRAYASLLPAQLRKVAVSEQFPLGVVAAFERVKDRVDARPTCSFVLYEETPHDGCEGGWVIVDILSGCLGGQVLQESPYLEIRTETPCWGEGFGQ